MPESVAVENVRLLDKESIENGVDNYKKYFQATGSKTDFGSKSSDCEAQNVVISYKQQSETGSQSLGRNEKCYYLDKRETKKINSSLEETNNTVPSSEHVPNDFENEIANFLEENFGNLSSDEEITANTSKKETANINEGTTKQDMVSYSNEANNCSRKNVKYQVRHYRKSRRTVKHTSYLIHTYFDDRWTKPEKTVFLKALREHGFHDVRILGREIPTKTPAQIQKYIDSWCRKALLSDKYDRLTSDKLTKKYSARGMMPTEEKKNVIHTGDSKIRVPTIDDWIKGFQKTRDENQKVDCRHIAKAFRYYALFAEHPCPDSAHGIDFKSLYYNLSRALKGSPPLAMNAASSFYYYQSIECMKDLYYRQGAHSENLLIDIKYRLKELGFFRQYRGKKEVQEHPSKSDANELQYLSSLHFNPAQLNLEALRRKPTHKIKVYPTIMERSQPNRSTIRKRRKRYFHVYEYFSKN